MATNPRSSQPPLHPKNPSQYRFACYLSSFDRLKTAIKALQEVAESHQNQQDNNIITSMEVNPTKIQFKVINGDQVLALFTIPDSDISCFDCDFNETMTLTYAIDCSGFSHTLERCSTKTNGILIKKLPSQDHLQCVYNDAKKKEQTHKVALSDLKEAIKFNPQDPFCTVVIKGTEWCNGAPKLLQIHNKHTNTKRMTFEITRHTVKFYTGEYRDDSKSFTYTDQENCHIKIIDEANEHEYTVLMPIIVEKPWTTALKPDNVGVMRLYYGNRFFMTLSFEQDSSNSDHGDDRGSIVFVYYPIVFLDVTLDIGVDKGPEKE